MNTNEVLKLALEALEWNMDYLPSYGHGTTMAINAITALREALAQPQQEPAAWMSDHAVGFKKSEFGATPTVPLYTSPPAQQQEPVATLWQHGETGRTRITMPGDITDCDARWFKAADLYTSPPVRKPLTNEQIETVWRSVQANDFHDCVKPFARAIEAAHGIKGQP